MTKEWTFEDWATSRDLDLIVIKLDNEQMNRVQRAWWRLRKWWAERGIR